MWVCFTLHEDQVQNKICRRETATSLSLPSSFRVCPPWATTLLHGVLWAAAQVQLDLNKPSDGRKNCWRIALGVLGKLWRFAWHCKKCARKKTYFFFTTILGVGTKGFWVFLASHRVKSCSSRFIPNHLCDKLPSGISRERHFGLLRRVSRVYLVYHSQLSCTPEPCLLPARCSEVSPAFVQCLTRPTESSLTNTCRNTCYLLGLFMGGIQNCLTGWIQLLALPNGHLWWVVRDFFGFEAMCP